MNVSDKIVIAFFFFFFASALRSQNLDSLKLINLTYDSILSSDDESLKTLFYKHKNDVLINDLGPYGSPFYYPTTHFLYHKELLSPYDSFNNSLNQLIGIKPFTNITYINASRKEQLFSIKHLQHFGKQLALNFDFIKLSSPGIYTNQEANHTDFKGTIKFHTQKDIYDVNVSTAINRIFYDENGGLYSLKDYENNVYDNEASYPVQLNNSFTSIKQSENQLNQRINLFQVGIDSSNFNTIFLKHQLMYTTKKRVFYDNDPLAGIFANVYLDSISTIDSVYSNMLSNNFSVGFQNANFSFLILAQNDQQQYVQNKFITSTFHTSYLGFASSLKKKELNINTIAKYGLEGYFKDDIESKISFNYNKLKYNIFGKVTYFLNEPEINDIYYISNHFIWMNEGFKKQSILDFRINLVIHKLKLDFSAETKILNNTLYFDSLAMSNQDKSTGSISTFSLSKDYRLLNFYFRTALIYQLTSNQKLFPLPEMIGRQVVYYQKYIFKEALKFQIGVGLSYSTGYYGYAYMPSLTEFYVQDNTRLGYYPKLDLFINTHLKRAQLFLKYEHINAGKSLYKSYTVLGYPSMNRSLKFGVSWNLVD